MTNDQVLRHCRQIDRCNQRGGRMLSIVDLIEARTLSKDLAAYALAAINAGASFMVGATPGGAGKTSVMGALLNFLPPDVELAAADGMATIQRASNTRSTAQRCCYICHEISSGHYYAYLWGSELRAYFDLTSAGHMLATNLHADTFQQAHEQICGDNAVPEVSLRQMNLMFFLSIRRSGLRIRRRIEQVWESDGQDPHRQVFDASSPSRLLDLTELVSPDQFKHARQTIDQLLASQARTIEQVRTVILNSR